eukprot:4047752-Prymnesium_polylepis.1
MARFHFFRTSADTVTGIFAVSSLLQLTLTEIYHGSLDGRAIGRLLLLGLPRVVLQHEHDLGRRARRREAEVVLRDVDPAIGGDDEPIGAREVGERLRALRCACA